MSSATSIRDALERIVQTSIELNRRDPDWTPMLMEFWTQAVRETVAREVVAGSLRECRQLIGGLVTIGQNGGLVRPDIEARAAAALILGLFDGTAFQAAVDPEDVSLERLAGPIAEMIERYIRSEGDVTPDVQDLQAKSQALLEEYRREAPEGGQP